MLCGSGCPAAPSDEAGAGGARPATREVACRSCGRYQPLASHGSGVPTAGALTRTPTPVTVLQSFNRRFGPAGSDHSGEGRRPGPRTGMAAPNTARASSEHRNRMMRATSSRERSTPSGPRRAWPGGSPQCPSYPAGARSRARPWARAPRRAIGRARARPPSKRHTRPGPVAARPRPPKRPRRRRRGTLASPPRPARQSRPRAAQPDPRSA